MYWETAYDASGDWATAVGAVTQTTAGCSNGAPVSSPGQAPSSGTAGTCGNGDVGNGICADETLCCSQYGYCGTGSDYC